MGRGLVWERAGGWSDGGICKHRTGAGCAARPRAAILLARETKGLLIGEAASSDVVKGIREIIGEAPDILHINELRTMHLGPYEILLALSVDFADGMSSQSVEKAVSQLEGQIKKTYPEVRRVFIEVQANHDGAVRMSR